MPIRNETWPDRELTEVERVFPKSSIVISKLLGSLHQCSLLCVAQSSQHLDKILKNRGILFPYMHS